MMAERSTKHGDHLHVGLHVTAQVACPRSQLCPMAIIIEILKGSNRGVYRDRGSVTGRMGPRTRNVVHRRVDKSLDMGSNRS